MKHFTLKATRTVMVVRRRVIRKEKSNGAYEFLILFDGSDESKKSLIEALKVVDPDKDIVHCVSFDTDGDMGKYEPLVTSILKDAKIVHGIFKIVPCPDENAITAVGKYLSSESTPDYDFVVLGTKGCGGRKRSDEQYLGSMAEKVITTARTNLILVVK